MSRDIGRAGIIGCTELLATYPIDYLKTLRQSGNNNRLFWSNPYRGVTSRFAAIIPVRMVFWGSYSITQTQKWSPNKSALFMAICETAVDFPPEQVKVQRMLSPKPLSIRQCFVRHSVYPSITSLFSRNLLFMWCYQHVYQSTKDSSYWSASIAGAVGSIISHPFDTLKTHYQSQLSQGRTQLDWSYFTVRTVFRGCGYRCVANFIGMGLGNLLLGVSS